MRFVYIVGAQCTGKTTLSKALFDHIEANDLGLKCRSLTETARKILKLHDYTREDIRIGGERCLEVQKLIMDAQWEAEQQAVDEQPDVVISDRSGVDPVVYARMYCGEDCAEQLVGSDSWEGLRRNLQKGLIVICEPVKEWLFDDNTRLMPNDWSEWQKTHTEFCHILEQDEIKYIVLPAFTRELQARVNFVYDAFKAQD